MIEFLAVMFLLLVICLIVVGLLRFIFRGMRAEKQLSQIRAELRMLESETAELKEENLSSRSFSALKKTQNKWLEELELLEERYGKVRARYGIESDSEILRLFNSIRCNINRCSGRTT